MLRLSSLNSFSWLGLCALLLCASLQLPVPRPPKALQAGEKSPAIAEVEHLIEEIKQSNLVDAESVERLSSEARQLGNRPLDEQYTHSALEAADQLRDQTKAAMQELAKNFDEAANTLDKAENSSPKMSDSDAKQAAQSLNAALQGMRSGQMAANEKLSSQLKGMNSQKLQQMSKEQLSKMRSAMQSACNKAGGIGGAKKSSQIAKGNGQKLGTCSNPGPGSGGDPAPLVFREKAGPDVEGKADQLQNDDYSRASFGDTMETTNGRHQVDTTKAPGAQSAGTVSGKAQGGDAVWVNRLTPAERAALKDFFK